MQPRRRRGFSLLEVMVAIAILGLALTIILSAQGGLAASNRSAANLGSASTLARCKMTETEEKLLKLGYPEIDQVDTEISCCEDADRDGFKCDVRVEKIELPNPPSSSIGDGGSLLGAPSGSGSADPLAAAGQHPQARGDGQAAPLHQEPLAVRRLRRMGCLAEERVRRPTETRRLVPPA